METYEIHNREVLLKAMETCAGPECGTGCPYKDKSKGGKSCRTVLLEDAMAALVKDKGDIDDLEAAARTVCEERDKLNKDLTFVIQQRDELAADKEMLRIDRDALREEITKMTEKREATEYETDRPSVCDGKLAEEVGKLIAQAKYQEGRADTLAEIVARCSFGGGCCHE